MKRFSLSDKNEKSSIQNIMNDSDTVFLIGSAVSIFSPSTLPSGMGIVKELEGFFLKHHTASASEYEISSIKSVLSKAAFEHLMNACPKSEKFQQHVSRVFNLRAFNDVHSQIANIAGTHKINIITTNYDPLIECALQHHGYKFQTIVEEKAIQNPIATPTIFKIHGCVTNPDSIVFKLSQEALMPHWKFSVFLKLISDKNLFIIGYSGKDFEICPALTAANPRHIYWNVRSFDANHPVFPSENMEHLFHTTPNISIIAGDMQDLFSCSANFAQNHQSKFINDFVAQNLSSNDCLSWKTDTFASLAAPKFAEREITINSLGFTHINQKLSDIAYRNGRYLSSFLYAYKHKMSNSNKERKWFHIYLDGSFKLRNAGCFLLAKICCFLSGVKWKKLPLSEQKETFLYYTWSLYLNFHRFFPHKSKKWLIYYAYWSLKKGAWGDYYNAEPHLRRKRINVAHVLRLKSPLMQARSGFHHIGNISSYIDEFTRDSYLNTSASSGYIKRIKLARSFELNPNGWKCAYAMLAQRRLSSWRKRRIIFKTFVSFLRKCQYNPMMKLYILYYGLVALLGFRTKRLM